MKLLGNIIWLAFGGVATAITWAVAGIPFGIQCFKIAGFVLWPFGRRIEVGRFGTFGLLGNIIWLLLFGWLICVSHFIIGLIFCATIIGIPFGTQHFKFAKLALLPFGARIIR